MAKIDPTDAVQIAMIVAATELARATSIVSPKELGNAFKTIHQTIVEATEKT